MTRSQRQVKVCTLSSHFMMAPIKVGIIGYGFSAKCFHLPFILPNPDLELYAVLQRAAPPAPGTPTNELPKFGHVTQDFPNVKHYRTGDEFFANPNIELVIDCSKSHDEYAEKAIKAGKHRRLSSSPRSIPYACNV
jgi:predicted dehydrogenase